MHYNYCSAIESHLFFFKFSYFGGGRGRGVTNTIKSVKTAKM